MDEPLRLDELPASQQAATLLARKPETSGVELGNAQEVLRSPGGRTSRSTLPSENL
jgi:hypothetical protein